jgi:hypothetical protein
VLQTNFEASYSQSTFEVVHIDVDNQTAAALHTYWNHDNPTFPVLVGSGSIYSQYGNGYIPYNVVLDPDGVVRYSAAGFSESALHSVIQQNMNMTHPFLELAELDVLSDDNGDGRPDPGETVNFRVRLLNSPTALAATSISISFSTDDGSLTETQTAATLPGLAPGQSAFSTQDFQFTVASDAQLHWASLHFTVQATYAGGTWTQTIGSEQRISRPDLLVVDSDGTLDDNETFVQTALAGLGLNYDMWTPATDGDLSAMEALAYSQIIWLGGIRNPDINTAERAALSAFLDRGGLLLLSSQYASSDPLNSELALRCGVQTLATAPGMLFLAATPLTDPWFGDMSFVLTGSPGASNCLQPDNLAVLPGGSLMATWTQGALAQAAAYRIQGGYNSIYCGFPIEALRIHSSRPNSVTLSTFLQRVFAFHAANPPQPLAPITDLALDCAPEGCVLSWSPVANAGSYRVYQSADPWIFPDTPLLETTTTSVPVPVSEADQIFFQVRSLH